MARLALAGSYYNLAGLSILDGGERVDVDVNGRSVPVLDCGEFLFLPRHGMEHYIPPCEGKFNFFLPQDKDGSRQAGPARRRIRPGPELAR